MINKTNALNRIEQIKNYLRNVKSTAYRGNVDDLEEQFERLDDMIEDLESVISSEPEEYLNRAYNGI